MTAFFGAADFIRLCTTLHTISTLLIIILKKSELARISF